MLDAVRCYAAASALVAGGRRACLRRGRAPAYAPAWINSVRRPAAQAVYAAALRSILTVFQRFRFPGRFRCRPTEGSAN